MLAGLGLGRASGPAGRVEFADCAECVALGLRDDSAFEVVELLASEQARFEH